MKRINEIFYSLQGEGHNVGRAAVFVRFSGCNRRCPFCDTEHESYSEMTDEEIAQRMCAYPSRFAVLTGGEPLLQADETFIDLLHRHGFTVAVETNGTLPLPANIDWSTVSPKAPTVVRRCDELKVVFRQEDKELPIDLSLNPDGIEASHYYLQPCDTGNAERNKRIMEAAVGYIKAHPEWRLSLQTHKLIGIK